MRMVMASTSIRINISISMKRGRGKVVSSIIMEEQGGKTILIKQRLEVMDTMVMFERMYSTGSFILFLSYIPYSIP